MGRSYDLSCVYDTFSVVVKLEGGSEEDVRAIDLPPPEPPKITEGNRILDFFRFSKVV